MMMPIPRNNTEDTSSLSLMLTTSLLTLVWCVWWKWWPSFIPSKCDSLLYSWWSYAVGWLKQGRRMSAPTSSSSTASGICLSSARRMRWSRWGSDELGNVSKSFHLSLCLNHYSFYCGFIVFFVILFCLLVNSIVTASVSWDGGLSTSLGVCLTALDVFVCVSKPGYQQISKWGSYPVWKLTFDLARSSLDYFHCCSLH